MEIRNAVALVTGGASGLGERCARDLVAEGARVAILDVGERGAEVAAELGDACIFCKTDVTSADSVKAAVDEAVAKFGAINIAVNCAGVATAAKVIGKTGPIDLAGFEKVISINLTGTLNVLRLAVEQMLKNAPNEEGEQGVVINTSSCAAFEGQIGQAAYSASKAGVAGMTLPIARELARYGIRNVTIAPGLFETPMLAGMPDKVRQSLIATCLFPKRLGKPSEFSLLVKQIIQNPMLNGATIRLDGALRMAPQ